MAEYNMNYMNIRKRLLTLKLLTESDMNLHEEFKKGRLFLIDHLLKKLDERYSENHPLSEIEVSVEKLERE